MTEFTMSMDPKWHHAIEFGDKRATTRLKRKCEVADYFMLNGRKYVVTRILGLPLWDAARFYEYEGFRTREEFIDAIKSYYPDVDDGTKVYIHFFTEVRE